MCTTETMETKLLPMREMLPSNTHLDGFMEIDLREETKPVKITEVSMKLHITKL